MGIRMRSVRAHMLCHSALEKLIIEELGLEENERQLVTKIFEDVDSNKLTFASLVHNEVLLNGSTRCHAKLNELKNRGATAALWVQYFKIVSIVKNYIVAERSGN